MPHDNDTPSKKLPKRWIRCPVEAEYLPDNRKETKLQRKIASATDRSKYKKTDRDKLAQQPVKKSLPADASFPKGRVTSITPQGIHVAYEDKIIACTLPGAFKKDKNRIKNLITVGDIVHFELSSPQEGSIISIEERKSTLSRADHLSRRKEQLLAANIDQVLITVSVIAPPLKPAIIDRYIIAAEKGGMEPIIIVNKIDLLQKGSPEEQTYQLLLSTYQALNIPILPLSAATGEGLDALREVMKDKSSVFSGQSGTGKSSLINAMTQLNLATADLTTKTNKGSHTTTTARLLPLPFGGWCIDTPGIRSFGLWRLDKDEVEGYFPEILKHSLECKYPSCLHLNEPGCAVRKAVEEGAVSPLRYESYQKLITDEDWDIPY
jgi:ribosome biogenesis GTPase